MKTLDFTSDLKILTFQELEKINGGSILSDITETACVIAGTAITLGGASTIVGATVSAVFASPVVATLAVAAALCSLGAYLAKKAGK